MDHKKLEAWKRSMQLAGDIYRYSQALPAEEKWGLATQLRRAAVSVPSNISEGAGRGSNRDFGRFVSIAVGSLGEIETQLILAEQLGYPSTAELIRQVGRVRSLVTGLRKHLQS